MLELPFQFLFIMFFVSIFFRYNLTGAFRLRPACVCACTHTHIHTLIQAEAATSWG